MTKEEKIKIRLLQILEMINEEEIETVEIPATAGFLVKSHDEPEEMTWYNAMEKFGPNGSDKVWRLPTRLELGIMCENKDKIPNITGGYYWSSRGGGVITATRTTRGSAMATSTPTTRPTVVLSVV